LPLFGGALDIFPEMREDSVIIKAGYSVESEFNRNGKKKNIARVTLSDTTSLKGTLRFKDTLCIRGKFTGTIITDDGDLLVDKGAEVTADSILVTNLGVCGTVNAPVTARDKVNLYSTAVVNGDLVAGRLRIADGALFKGKCSMIDSEKREVEIFSRPTAEIKAELTANRSDPVAEQKE